MPEAYFERLKRSHPIFLRHRLPEAPNAVDVDARLRLLDQFGNTSRSCRCQSAAGVARTPEQAAELHACQ